MSLGAAFWDELFGEAESRPLRSGRGYGPLGPPDENGVRLPEGFRSRVVARGDEVVPGTGYRWHLASDGMASFPRRGRRLRARVQLGDDRGRGVGAPLRPRRAGRGRLPDPLRHDPELLRRRDPLGHLALVRGGRGRARVGMRSERPPSRGRASGDGCLQARGRRRRPARPPRLPDRGPDRRRALPLHPGRLARPLPRPARDRAGERRARRVGGAARPAGPPRAHAAAGGRIPAAEARGGDLARREHALRLDHGRPPGARLRHPAASASR